MYKFVAPAVHMKTTWQTEARMAEYSGNNLEINNGHFLILKLSLSRGLR